MRRFFLSTAVALTLGASAGMAQPQQQPEPQPSAFGVPQVGTSGGPYCNAVTVTGIQFAVPNTDSNAAAMLIILSAAEARGQKISVFTPFDLGIGPAKTQCEGLIAGNGDQILHLKSFR